jgi:hypothetical protein
MQKLPDDDVVSEAAIHSRKLLSVGFLRVHCG